MIKVCDAIMGTGKSQSAITYMNEHIYDKFIYITPYLDEANRIKKNCPDLHFVEPSNKLEKYEFRKFLHTAALIKEGKNITTTHQAFKSYTKDVLDDIREQGYTLIIDENVEVLEKLDIHIDDLNMLVEAGYLEYDNGTYTRTDKIYDGEMYKDLFRLLESRELVDIKNIDENNVLFFWVLPSDLILSFKEVIILTYLFEGQSLHYFMQIYNLKYEYIGIERTETGNGFRFCEPPGYTPEYVCNLREMLNIVDNPKLNHIGDNRYALSKNWYSRGGSGVDKLKKNVSNYYNNMHRDVPAERRLWGSFNGAFAKIKGKGYTKGFLTFNTKATNAYKNRDCLVYLVNVFMNTNEKLFYEKCGIEVDEDRYALSIMIQWIWRSAIRDGKKVNLYIPSKRMRDLLNDWIEETSKGEKYIEQ